MPTLEIKNRYKDSIGGNMRKIVCGFLVLIFISVFSSKAYCGFLNDLKSSANQAAKDTAGQIITNIISETNKGKPSTSSESKLTYVELSKGMYGIPFDVNLQEVLKWCEENKVNIANITKQEVEHTIRCTLSRVRGINKTYDVDKDQLSEIEKSVLELTLKGQMDYGQMDLEDQLKLDQAKRLFEDLKAPSFDYKGQELLLNREFEHGETISIGKVEKVCTDKRIINMIYNLTIIPSDSSEKLINDNLSSIKIYFTRDDSGDLVSYATFARFMKSSFMNSSREAGKVLAKQYNSVFKVLSEKYGNPVYREKLGTKRNELHPTYQGVTYSAIEDNTPEGNIYHLTGIDFLGYDALLWKKNVILITKFRNNDLSAPDAFEKGFYVIYYEPNIANSVLGYYEQAIRDFRDSCSKEDIKKESQMKENF